LRWTNACWCCLSHDTLNALRISVCYAYAKSNTHRGVGYGANSIFNQGVHSPFEPFSSERGWYGDNQCLVVYVDSNGIPQPSFETWSRDL
jgi:hypothetical protein